MKKITFNIIVLIAFLFKVNGALAQVPTITTFAPSSGHVGTNVTITGSNFNTNFANNIVFFGATKATVSAGNATSLTVAVPIGASYQPISVTNITNGLTAYSAKPFITTFFCGGVISATSFAPKVDFAIGTPIYISTGDFDGDGKTDLAVANQDSNTVSILRNTGSSGTISFAPKVDFAIGTPAYISICDFDGDGKLDLAVSNIISQTVSVFRNTGSSGIISFAAKMDFETGILPSSLSIGDFNGDGKPDLAVLNIFSQTVSVFRNTGSSGIISFAAKVDFNMMNGNPNGISIGDFDGDGKADLAVVNRDLNTVSVFRNTSASGGGIISFATNVDFTTGTEPVRVSTGDFDGDGKTDLAVLNILSQTVSILRNTGSSGTISYAAKVDFSTGVYPNNVSISDLDGDGKLDLAVLNNYSFSVFKNTGSSGTISFAAKVDFITGGQPQNPSIGDLDGDGKADLAVAITNFGIVSVLRNLIYVGPSVTANATATTICPGASVTLTGGGANTYIWSGGVTDGVGFVPPPGTTTYTVTGTDLNGCANTATITINVNPPILTFSSTPTNKCSGACSGTATITNVFGGEPPYTYQWDANANNQTTPTASSLCQGYYSVTVTDINGCSVTENVQIEVNTISDVNIYLTNLAAVDQVNVSPAFSSFYTYNLPATINPNSTNPRNFVDPGKKARFKVECTNQKGNGQSIVSGICKVRSNNPNITVTDSSSALNNIGWNNKAWSADEFEIDIDPNTPPGTNVYIDFIVQENGQDYVTTCISIPISPLVYSPTSSSTIDDDSNPDSQGNDNDICEQGETIEFYPWLDNISTLDAEYVRGRFENLDNLSYINIWNGVQGTNTTVYNAGWWNYAFAEPTIINANSFNTTPEYDFVFNYNNTNIINNFNLYMVMAGGFKLFSGNALSLVQWSLPYKFRASGSVSIGSTPENKDYINIYPNPTNDLIIIENKNENFASPYVILNSLGMQMLAGKLIGASTTIDINHLSPGIYILQVGETEKRIFKLMKK